MCGKPTVPRKNSGFTLLELLVAISILSVMTMLSFISFHAINRSWQIGREVINNNGHADYVMEQLSSALRSAYYPGEGYGFSFEDDGEDADARDKISWSKIGNALIGEQTGFADVPHRVEVYISKREDRENNPGGFTIKAWRQGLQLEDFDPEEDVKEVYLSPRVIGFNCRMLDPDAKAVTSGEEVELEWLDEWTKTNTLPTAVEITLWLQAPEEDGEPVESKRIVEIPMGAYSQDPSGSSSSKSTTTTTTGGGSSGLVTGGSTNGGRGSSRRNNGGRNNTNGGRNTGSSTGIGIRPGGSNGGMGGGGGLFEGGNTPPRPNR